MPQEFHVLQCSRCRTFQVQQVKKAKKWACKMCGEKQSVLRVYGRGTGAECRQHVQKLNGLRGELEEKKEQLISATRVEDSADHLENFQIDECEVVPHIQQTSATDSKWSQYIEPVLNNKDDDEDNNKCTTDWGQYHTNIHHYRKQKRLACKQKGQNTNHSTTTDETSWSAINYNPKGPSIKRPPDNHLSSRTVKRTKWTAYEDDEESNWENLDDSHKIPLPSKPKVPTNQQARIPFSSNQHLRATVSTNQHSISNGPANQHSGITVSTNQHSGTTMSSNQQLANISVYQNSGVTLLRTNQDRKATMSSNQQPGTINSANPKAHKAYENTFSEANFTLCDIDDFLGENDGNIQKLNISSFKNHASDQIRKTSKWDMYLSQSSDDYAIEDFNCDDSNLVDIPAMDKFQAHKTDGFKGNNLSNIKEIAQNTSLSCESNNNSPNEIINGSSCKSKTISTFGFKNASSFNDASLSESELISASNGVENASSFNDASFSESELISASTGVENASSSNDEVGVNCSVQYKFDSEETYRQCPKVKNITACEEVSKSSSTVKERTTRPVFEMGDLDDAEFEFAVY